jgi:hypothetical protein
VYLLQHVVHLHCFHDMVHLPACLMHAHTLRAVAVHHYMQCTAPCAVQITSCEHMHALMHWNAAPQQFGLLQLNTITLLFPSVQGRRTGCTATASCPDVPGIIILSENATSPAEYCLSITGNACPPAQLYNNRSFPLYSGVTATGATRLRRCIRPFASAACDSATPYTTRIKGSSGSSGNVTGCMTSLPATPCPITSPFFYMGPDLAVVECRQGAAAACNATAAPYDAFTVRVASADGKTLQGCMQSGAKRCPNTAAGNAYNYPFFLLGDGSNVDECRQASSPIVNCSAWFSNYRGSTNTYNVAYIADSTMGATETVPAAGCAKSSIVCSPATGFQVAQLSAAGAIEACRPTGSTCGGSYPLRLHNADGTTLEGCAPALTDCPSTGWWTFGLYARTDAGTPAAKLMSCRSIALGSLPNCSSTAFPGHTVNLLNATGALAGCSAVNAQVRLM